MCRIAHQSLLSVAHRLPAFTIFSCSFRAQEAKPLFETWYASILSLCDLYKQFPVTTGMLAGPAFPVPLFFVKHIASCPCAPLDGLDSDEKFLASFREQNLLKQRLCDVDVAPRTIAPRLTGTPWLGKMGGGGGGGKPPRRLTIGPHVQGFFFFI